MRCLGCGGAAEASRRPLRPVTRSCHQFPRDVGVGQWRAVAAVAVAMAVTVSATAAQLPAVAIASLPPESDTNSLPNSAANTSQRRLQGIERVLGTNSHFEWYGRTVTRGDGRIQFDWP